MTIASPSISVCMPVYNVKRYVAEAVESILGQTFGDFELLILDDGSTDGTLGIVRRYAERDPRIRLTSRPNKGLVATLNELIEQARGEFIARMDGDDVAMPGRFERQMDYLGAHPECIAVGCRARVIDSDGDPVCDWFTEHPHEVIDALHLQGEKGSVICHPSVMMRREAVLAVGKYREHLPLGEEHDLFLRMAERGRLAILPEPLLRYRNHPESFTHTPSRMALRHRVACEIVADARRRRNLPPEPPPPEPTAMQPPNSRVNWAWWALSSGHVRTARKHAWRIVAQAPFSRHSWKLMFCAIRGY